MQVDTPRLGNEYWKVENVLDLNDKNQIMEMIPSMKPTNIKSFSFPLLKIFYCDVDIPMTFTHHYKIQEPSSASAHIKNQPLRDIYCKVIEHFAATRKFQGEKKISFKLFQVTPEPFTLFKQQWHYDRGAIETMVVIIDNQCPYAPEGCGLDIALNGIEKNCNSVQWCEDESVAPKANKWISVPYEDAIIVESQQGNVIHKMSTLLSQTKGACRTAIQIKISDPD